MIFGAGVLGLGGFGLGILFLLVVIIGLYALAIWFHVMLFASAGDDFREMGLYWLKAYIPFYNVYLWLKHHGKQWMFWLWFGTITACTTHIVLAVVGGLRTDTATDAELMPVLISSTVLFASTVGLSFKVKSVTPFLSWAESVFILWVASKLL